MSFLRPHTIKISRQTMATSTTGLGIGAYSGYSGAVEGSETTVADNLPANIYLMRTARALNTDIPGEAVLRSMYRVVFSSRESSLVEKEDIITDDNGVRYQVTAPYWSSLGYSCLCERLEM